MDYCLLSFPYLLSLFFQSFLCLVCTINTSIDARHKDDWKIEKDERACVCLFFSSSSFLCVCVCVWGGGGGQINNFYEDCLSCRL